MSKLESQNLPTEAQISDELTTDDLEQVSGGIVPLVAGIAVGAIFVGGVIKGAMDEEADERDRARGRR